MGTGRGGSNVYSQCIFRMKIFKKKKKIIIFSPIFQFLLLKIICVNCMGVYVMARVEGGWAHYKPIRNFLKL